MTQAAERISPVRARPVRLARRLGQREYFLPLVLILPTMLAVLAVIGFPWLYSGWMSLNDVNWYSRTWTFVGLGNYLRVLPDPAFQGAFGRTGYFAAVSVVGSTALGLLMALVLNERFIGRGFMRSVVLLPWAMSTVVVGVLWFWIYDGGYGALNGVLWGLGLIDSYIPWLADGFRALNLAAVVFIWHVAPLSALLLLAGLQAIPPNLYNAAKVDGAGAVQRSFALTLPWLRSMLLLTLIVITIGAIMQFDLIFVLTQGGPGSSTTVFSWLGYQTTFAFFRFGEGTAIFYILSLCCLALAGIYMLLLYRRPTRTHEPGIGGADPASGWAQQAGSLASMRTPRRAFERGRVRRTLLGGRLGQRLARVAIYASVLVIALWSLLPFAWLVVASLTNQVDLLSKPPRLIPIPPVVENYVQILSPGVGLGAFRWGAQTQKIAPGLINSVLVGASVTVLNLAIGSLAGYAYARHLRFGFMRGTMLVLMLTRMIPGLSLMVPFFIMFQGAGLFDTKTGLVIAYSAFILPLTVWIMRGYFETVPRNIEAAARVDGCTWFEAFTKVFLPVSLPGLIAAAIFCFIVAWNEFLFALILTSTTNAQTITVIIAGLAPSMLLQQGYGPLFAAGVLAVLPPVLIAFFFQKHLIQGMLSGSSKG
jgi:multiple sugar transport system permease protein